MSMTSRLRTLSKSDFKVGRTCPTKLYYKESGQYQSVSEHDPYLALLAQGGFMIEQLAKARYVNGVEMSDWSDPKQAWRATESALRSGDVVLFEATLLNGRQLARVDILQRKGNELRLIEVKAKSWSSEDDRERADSGKPREFWTGKKQKSIASKWREYLEDVTYQTLILEALFPEFTVKPYLCLVDKAARCVTDALPEQFEILRNDGGNGNGRIVSVKLLGDASTVAQEQLTIEIPVSEEVDALRDEVRDATALFLASYEPELQRIRSPISTACKDCEYRVADGDLVEGKLNGFAECWGALSTIKPSVLDLYQVSRLKGDNGPLADRMLADGIAGLLEIPAEVVGALPSGGPIAQRQWIQLDHTRRDKPFIGDGLKEALDGARYPLYFLDFEAARTAVPFHSRMQPYGLLAFQWSCHIVDSPGAPLRHLEWINTDRSWPNLAFAESLEAAIGASGTVLTWSPFEASTLRTVQSELKERGLLHAALESLFSIVNPDHSSNPLKIVDMHRLALTEFFHPGMGGRTSIKVVLDALWRSDEQMRLQFDALTGKRGDPLKGPYAALEPLTIAGVLQSVAEGTGAIRAYEAMMFGQERHQPDVQASWRQLLLEYCKLDTLAMVLIWEHWRRAVATHNG